MDKWTEVHRPLIHSLYDDYDSVFPNPIIPRLSPFPKPRKERFSLISSSCTCPWPEFVKFLYRPTFVKDYRKEIYTKFGAFRSLEVQSFHQRISFPCDRFPAYSVIDFTETRKYGQFYSRKFAEAKKHHHRRAIVLTARKLLRLVFALLHKHQAYQPRRAAHS